MQKCVNLYVNKYATNRKERYFAMACLKKELRTKDKKQIEYIYKKIKGYALLLGRELGDCEGLSKDLRIQWIDKAYNNASILNAVISNITIKEFCNVESLVNKQRNTSFEYNNYWEKMGLLYTEYDGEYEEYSISFVEELTDFIKCGGEKFLEKLGIKATINSVVSSMVNLYGIIDIKKAYEIFCDVTFLKEKVSYSDFMQTALRFADFREEFDICIYADSFVSMDYVEVSVTKGLKKVIPTPAYYELICKQGDKPYYTNFTIEKLLCYEYPGSFEIDSYIDEFVKFLSETFMHGDDVVFGVADEVCLACIDDCGINDIFDLLENKGFYSKSQKIQKMLVKHIMQIKNNVRLRTNRGYSINELRGISYDASKVCTNL